MYCIACADIDGNDTTLAQAPLQRLDFADLQFRNRP
jgi:hypothetical protein